MSEEPRDSDPRVKEAERVSPGVRRNGQRKNGTARSSIPDINIRELYAERNWAALTGLGLIALGIITLIQDFIGLHLEVWSLALIGIGGWLMYDAWEKYQANGKRWNEHARARMTGGSVISLIGLLAILEISGLGLMLIAIGGWLLYDAWQRYEKNGRIMSNSIRNRVLVGGGMALFGLFMNGPLVLIVLGLIVLIVFKQFGEGR